MLWYFKLFKLSTVVHMLEVDMNQRLRIGLGICPKCLTWQCPLQNSRVLISPEYLDSTQAAHLHQSMEFISSDRATVIS